VAVTNNGSVIWTGTAWDAHPGDDDQTVPMTLVKKYLPNGTECWTLEFRIGPGGNSVAARALALAHPWADPPTPTIAPVGYVGGRLLGEVQFGSQVLSVMRDSGYVAKIHQNQADCPGAQPDVSWVTVFEPTEVGTRSVVNAIATATTSRDSCPIQMPPDGTSLSVYGRVVVGGFFKGETDFGSFRLHSTDGSEDGFVAILDTQEGAVLSVFAVGGPGDQRITAVALDERTQDIVVAGWFDHAQTDFDPGAGVVHPAPGQYRDGRDLFVARYRVRPEGITLRWLYTVGSPATPGADFIDDEASCLALSVDDTPHVRPHTHHDPYPACQDGVAPRTLAIVGGSRGDAATTVPGSGARDLVFLAVAEPDSGVYADAKWVYSPHGGHDERVTAVAVDGIGRPVFTGWIGCGGGGTPCMGEAVDFDPGSGTLTLPSDSQNAFVASYHPVSGALEWAYAVGGNLGDGGTAIAFDPVHTSRFAFTGFFGRPDAMPTAYTIDLDPDPAAAFLVTREGFSDSFLSVLDPHKPQYVGFQISLVLSNACSMTQTGTGELSREFADMLDGLRIALQNSGVIPWRGQPNPGNGQPRHAAVQVNAVFYSTRQTGGRRAVQVMPWTVFDARTAPLFARRLAALAPLDTGPDHSQALGDGMLEALASLGRSGHTPGELEGIHSVMLVINDAPGGPDVPAARDAAHASTKFDRICALGGYGTPGAGGSPPPSTREYQLLDIIAPTFPGQSADDIDRQSTGISTAWSTLLRTPEPCEAKWYYYFFLERLLQRLAWCPSDYTRDECTDGNGGESDDYEAWSEAFGRQAPYSDWNMDGRFTIDPDYPKFRIDIDRLPPLPNARVCHTCPGNS
jgi:hypothetical protein